MKLSLFGRLTMALLASVALGLGMTACGGGTIGYMWVLGQQYNQVAGFKIDDYTGNLTAIPRSPFSSGGTKPVSIVVKAGGRFIYVVNQGVNGGPQTLGSGSGIVEFAVGGDGTLTYEATYQTQGYVSQWAQIDSSGSYLYVLDKYAPDATTASCAGSNPTNCNGAITVFSIDANTGRLSLVTNSQTQVSGVNTSYWKVGGSPFMMKATGGCLFTVNSADQSISPFSVGSGGQLVYTQTQHQLINSTSVTSINGNGSYVYLTDSNNGSATSYIYPFTISSGCTLTQVTGGKKTNLTNGINPSYSMLDNSGKYLYVLNQSNTTTTTSNPISTISAFTLTTSTGQLQDMQGAPFTVGSGPVCMVEDTSNQYIYISSFNDGTITGKVIDPTTGLLSDLKRGATFTGVGQASCLVLSGSVS